MATNNPFLGGPDYPRWLAAGIDKKQALFCPAPPASGGQQISIRLRPERLILLDVLSARSEWSRNQVIDGLLEAALAQLFHYLSDAAAEEVIDDTSKKVLEHPR